MKNAEWILKNNRKFGNMKAEATLSGKYRLYDKTDNKTLGTYRSASCTGTEACLRWLDMDVDPIDDNERYYLNGIIMPFIKQGFDVTIAKFHSRPDTECIIISYSDGDRSTSMPFPDFEEGTRYKGMVCGHEYMPKELGL